MSKFSASLAFFVLVYSIFLSGISVGPVLAQSVESDEQDSEASFNYHGYEAVAGVTMRAQALIVYSGSSSSKRAVMTGRFIPYPQIFINTPFRPFSVEKYMGEEVGRTGYYWKISYNRFSLDRQEDPDTGGIGPASPVYDYGTRVKGEFFAVAPVFAHEMLKPDGGVPFRIELGLGLGYLDLAGDIVLGDWEGDPLAPATRIDHSGMSVFLFMMGRHQWGSLMFGYQMGISISSGEPYSYNQSYVSLDFGYKIML
jgi:hypothetical protein